MVGVGLGTGLLFVQQSVLRWVGPVQERVDGEERGRRCDLLREFGLEDVSLFVLHKHSYILVIFDKGRLINIVSFFLNLI